MKAEEILKELNLPSLSKEEIESIDNHHKSIKKEYQCFKNCSFLGRYYDGKLLQYTCQQVRLFRNSWLEEFRKENGSDQIETDPYYEQFKNQIDEFLNKCTCNERFHKEVEESVKWKTENPLKIERHRVNWNNVSHRVNWNDAY